MRQVNDLGPAKSGTDAENDKEKVCYYNHNRKDRTFNCFLAIRKQTPTTDDIIFSIVNLIDKSNKREDIHFKISDELREFNNVFQPNSTIRRFSENNFDGKTNDNQQQERQQQYKQQRRDNSNRQLSKKP